MDLAHFQELITDFEVDLDRVQLHHWELEKFISWSMDEVYNLASHKVAGIREAIDEVGASVWYLPPYSPDLNPIEKMWSKVKTWLRRIAARTVEGLIQAIGDALRDVDANECRAYFKSGGYAKLDC